MDDNVRMRTFASFFAVLVILLGGAAAQSKRHVEGPFPAKAGEICIVCYGVVDVTGLAFLVDGRRFAVDASESGEFLQDPDAYIQAYDAHHASETRRNLLITGAAVVLVGGALLFLWRRRRSKT